MLLFGSFSLTCLFMMAYSEVALVHTKILFFLCVAEEKELRRLGHVTSDRFQGGSGDQVNISDYEEGRAEALGVLCSIFTSEQCAESFLPVYLARFYHALTVGLQYNEKVSDCIAGDIYKYCMYDRI